MNPHHDEALLQDHVAHVNAWHDRNSGYADAMRERDVQRGYPQQDSWADLAPDGRSIRGEHAGWYTQHYVEPKDTK